jgi:hypothetical protein
VIPREVLSELEGLGFRLTLRPGGLRLTGEAVPPPMVLALVRENRDALIDFLETEARVQAAHQASLVAGRLTNFPAHLLTFVQPSIRRVVASDGGTAE